MDVAGYNMLKSLRIPVEKLKDKEVESVKQRVTCLRWELGRTPSTAEVKVALVRAFEDHLDIRLVPGGLTDEEQRLFEERLPAFESPEWIDLVHPRFEKTEVVQAAHKSRFGLVRFTLSVNLPRKTLKAAYITGDFLAFPSRALFDLEARLRGLPLDSAALCQVIVDFFEQGKISIPGMAHYRRVQLARYLIDEGLARADGFVFAPDGRLLDFGLGADRLREIVDCGEPFRTSGCPGNDGEVACNRPFANSRPGQELRNFPFRPESADLCHIRRELKSVLARCNTAASRAAPASSNLQRP